MHFRFYLIEVCLTPATLREAGQYLDLERIACNVECATEPGTASRYGIAA